MSTADSQLLVSTTVLTEDLIGNYFQKLKNRFDLLTIGRVLTIMIGLLAFYLAWQSTNLVFETVSYAWGGLGASFGPALLLTLWWKRISRVGVIAGMITGTLFTVMDLFGDWVSVRFSAFIIAFIAVYLFSILKPDET
jgi:sodium/proline symporter